jgi:hypothetical protein
MAPAGLAGRRQSQGLPRPAATGLQACRMRPGFDRAGAPSPQEARGVSREDARVSRRFRSGLVGSQEARGVSREDARVANDPVAHAAWGPVSAATRSPRASARGFLSWVASRTQEARGVSREDARVSRRFRSGLVGSQEARGVSREDARVANDPVAHAAWRPVSAATRSPWASARGFLSWVASRPCRLQRSCGWRAGAAKDSPAGAGAVDCSSDGGCAEGSAGAPGV